MSLPPLVWSTPLCGCTKRDLVRGTRSGVAAFVLPSMARWIYSFAILPSVSYDRFDTREHYTGPSQGVIDVPLLPANMLDVWSPPWTSTRAVHL